MLEERLMQALSVLARAHTKAVFDSKQPLAMGSNRRKSGPWILAN